MDSEVELSMVNEGISELNDLDQRNMHYWESKESL